MKLTSLIMAVVAACAFAQSAEARAYHHHHYTSHRHEYRHEARRHEYRHEARGQEYRHDAHRQEYRRYARRHGYAWRYAAESGRGYAGEQSRGYEPRRTAYRGGYGGRPRAWCGWYMRHLLGVADSRFNLARNWAHWGHSGAPGVGAVVVWSHHVGKIVGREGGQWVIQSGNDGHAVRIRPRSIAGAIAIRWG